MKHEGAVKGCAHAKRSAPAAPSLSVADDRERDLEFIRALSECESLAIKEHLSLLKVLRSHPIINLVRAVRAERLERYPAISD